MTMPIFHDETYMKLLSTILKTGVLKGDRTGTGTLSVFGAQVRFDLREAFPLLTTKKLPLRWVAEELFWFLRGSTDEGELRHTGVDIWKEWATEEQCARFGRAKGDLGPIYGWAWRQFGKPYPQNFPQPKPCLREDLEPTYLGIANGSGGEGHPLKKTWEGMIARCYDPKSPSYKYYGARGVSVCDEWLEFRVFAADAIDLPGYVEGSGRVLDKDGRVAGHSYLYSPQTCQWITARENARLVFGRTFVLRKGDTVYRVREGTVNEFCKAHGADGRNLSDLWTGRKNAKTRYGFTLVSIEDPEEGVDQIRESLDLLVRSPDSRRILVTGWNPREATQVALPPCHTIYQFETQLEDDKRVLSCHMYQRSADVFLGVPFNIASYALLTHMFAHVLGYGVGDLIISFGDVHIYRNHMEQVEEQMSRPARKSPTLRVEADFASHVPMLDRLLAIEWPHIKLEGYQPHPKISAPVAV